MDATWESRLIACAGGVPDEAGFLDQQIVPSAWYPTLGPFYVILQIRPPASCECGQIDVHVTCRSTGEKAIVEFSLDPSAQGTGCYTV